MKNLSAILALMILLFAGLACSDSGRSFASNEKPADENARREEKHEASGVYIEWLKLYRDDGSGDEGEEVEAFKTTDNPQHFIAQLSEFEGGTKVKFVFTAVNAGGEKNYKIAEKEIETNSFTNRAVFTFKMPKGFPTGEYRLDAYINGKVSKTVNYKIQK